MMDFLNWAGDHFALALVFVLLSPITLIAMTDCVLRYLGPEARARAQVSRLKAAKDFQSPPPRQDVQ